MKSRLGILLVIVASLAFVNGARCQSGGSQISKRKVLRGYRPPIEALSRMLGRIAGTNSLRLAISLPLRNREALASLLQRLYDPASADYRHYLTPAQFTEQFGPTPEDYQSVIKFAKASGLAIDSTHDSRILLDVVAKERDIERAFHVTLRRYQHPTEDRQFYAADADAWVDPGLPISGVAGLSDYVVLRSPLHKTPTAGRTGSAGGTGPNGYYMGQDFRIAYAPGVSLQGSGQRVGLFEADGYYASDIANYEDVAELSSVPLQNVLIDNFAGAPGLANGEVAVDIETAISMAPGLAAVVVFESSNNVANWLDILDRMASSNQIKQFSSSWGYIGGSDPNTSFDSSFQQMAAQGQSFFQASGDGDAWTTPVWTPGDSPYVTSVGGTTLTMAALGAAYSSETVWNSGNMGASNAWFGGGNGYLGSGGGVSTVYSIPSWQQTVSMTANLGSTSMRNIPDVALTALNVWVAFDNGNSGSYFGTSCSPPLWAGFAALANQQAASSNKPPVGLLNPAIYALGQGPNYNLCFHDVTAGSNTSGSSPGKYFAVPGYDLCTGWGTPAGSNLISALAGVYQPSITTQPSGQSIAFGSSTSLGVSTTGSPPLSYQWQFNGTNVAGATSTNLLLTNTTPTAAGSYTVIITNQWGVLTSSVAVLTVSKGMPAVTWANPAPIIYGAPLTSGQLNAAANVPGAFIYTPPSGTVLTAGTNSLSVVFTPTDTVDYRNVTNTANLVVSRSPLTITANNRTKSYGQTVTFAGTDFGAAGLVNGNILTSVTLSSSGAVATAAVSGSPYTIIPSAAVGTGLANYSITYANGALTVNHAALTITANNRNKTYGQAVTFAGSEFTVGGLLNSDTVTSATLNSSGAAATSAVTGSPYTIVPSAAVGAGLANYAISYSSGALTVSLLAITVTAKNRTKTYGQAVAFAGTEFTTSGLVNGDTLTSVTLASSGAAATAAAPGSPYNIVASAAVGTGLASYAITYVSGALTVNPAPLTVTAGNRSKTYGQSVTFAGTEFATSGLLNGDTAVSVALSSSGTASTATVASSPYATIPSAAAGTGLNNYTIAYINGALTVNPAALTVTASNRTKTYGQTVTFAGTEFIAGGLLNSDTVASATLASSGTAANATVAGSPYAIVPSAAIGSGLGNYSITYLNGALTAQGATPAISWANPAAIIYGAPITATQLNATANVPGTFVYSPANGSVLNAGANQLSANFTPSDSADYRNATNAVTLVVSNEPLAVTAPSTNRVYGQINPALTGVITGLTNGDNVTAAYATSATLGSPPGVYAITPTLVDPNQRLTNYAVNIINGALTVSQATPSIIWADPAPVLYGSSLGSNQLDASANVAGSLAYSPTNGTVLNVGANNLSALFNPADAADYDSVTDTVSLLVVPAALTVTASNFSRPFGTANPGFAGMITGLTNGDDITANYNCAATMSSPIGSYPIVPSLADLNDRQTNYTVNIVNGILVVGHPTQAFTWTNPAPITYGTFLSAAQLNATANVPGSYAYNPTNGAAINTGTNTLSVIFTPADAVDYSGVTDSVTLVVLAASLAITAVDTNRIYGGANPVLVGSISGVTNGDNITASYDCSATASSPVGVYPIAPEMAVGSQLTNYTVTYISGALTINPAPLEITANNQSKIYGQTVAFSGTEFAAVGLVDGDTVNGVSLSSPGAMAAAAAGSSPYAIVPSAAVGTGLGNYSISYTSGMLTVNPAALTITANNRGKTYGQIVAFTGSEFAAGGLINSDTVTSVNLTSLGAAVTASVASSPYAVIPSAAVGAGLNNYSISYANGTLTVSPEALSITANNRVKTYGQSVIFAGTEFSTGGLVNGDAVTSVTLTSAGAGATAIASGSPYAIVPNSAVGAGLANYSITYANGALAVNPASLTVTANNQSKTYGQPVTFAGSEFAASGLLNSDTVTSATLSSSGASATATVAGSPYAIIPSAALGAGLNNYAISYTSGALTTTPAALMVTADDRTKSYGQPVTFAGTEFTTSGLVNGDAVTSAALNSSGAAATATIAGSPYAIVPSASVGAGLDNYAISYSGGVLSITPASLTVTADNRTKTYGQTVTFAGTEFGAGGLLNSDTVASVALTSAGAVAAATVAGSPYTILSSSAIGTGLNNYLVTYFNGALSVGPAPLTITADSLSKSYGETITFAGTEFEVSGLVNGNTVTSVTLTSSGATGAAPVTNSPYAIVPGVAIGAGLANYTINYINGVLTIIPWQSELQSAKQFGGLLAFSWSATESQTYQVQFRTNLYEGDWIDLGCPIDATNSSVTASDSITNSQMYYRVVLLP